MSGRNEDNDFTKILTTTPPSTSSGKGLARTDSWFKNDNKLVTCPSCKGSGIKETTNELVALIPYSDERLQPRYTSLKITIALVITAIILGCLFFVFFPRHASAESTGVSIISGEVYNIDAASETWLMIQDNVTIKNSNYFPIVIDQLNISLAISWTEGVQMEVGNSMIQKIQIPAHVDNLTLPYKVRTSLYPVDRLFRTCCYLFAGHYIWYRVNINARYKLAFVGNYYFSSSHVTTVPVECDYYTNSNISCHYVPPPT